VLNTGGMLSKASAMQTILSLNLVLVSAYGFCHPADASCLLDDAEGSFLIQKQSKHVKREKRSLQADQERLTLLEAAGQPVMDDVMSAFNAMGSDGKLIDVSEGSDWPSEFNNYMPPYTNHIEGIQRFRPTSGKSTYVAFSGPGDSYSHLFIAELDVPAAAGPIASGSSTPQGSITNVIKIDSTFNHAGGFQANGDILAIGAEKGCNAMLRLVPGACSDGARVYFYDVSDPSNPVKLAVNIDRDGTTAGAVGILKQASGSWMVIAGDGNNDDLTMYVQDDDGSFHQAATWSKSELLTAPGVSGKYKSYQSMNLILQSDGTIFMICTTRDPQMIGHDYFDLFTVAAAGNGRATITMVASKTVTAHGADFSAGAGIYVDSSTNLIGYGSGWLPASVPATDPPLSGTIIPVNEF